MGIFNIFKKDKTHIKLPLIGILKLEKTEEAGFLYKSYFDELTLDEDFFLITIYFKKTDAPSIARINEALKNLGRINNIVKQEILLDLNDGTWYEYVDNIFKRILTESEYLKLIQNSTIEERLLAAFRIAKIKLYDEPDGLSIVLHYIFGYEIEFTFKVNGNYEIQETKFEAGSYLCKKQFSDFNIKFEDPDMNEKCSRFKKDWWNHPIVSYYIYKIAEKVKKYL
jgi:hypothetical protein